MPQQAAPTEGEMSASAMCMVGSPIKTQESDEMIETQPCIFEDRQVVLSCQYSIHAMMQLSGTIHQNPWK
jgi:hypothetical protein